MQLAYDTIVLQTDAPLQVVDITAALRERLAGSGLRDGLVTAALAAHDRTDQSSTNARRSCSATW
jgi:thiamine phosphate synthase YjbQ (UPF0047 family)